ncbi:MAG: Hsp20/alpha crystallin family protein [Bacillus sp. (in: firmicutes)]
MHKEQNDFKGWDDFPKETEKVLGESFWNDFQKIMPKKTPPIDLLEDETHGYVCIELAGITNTENLSVSFNGQNLIIEGTISHPTIFDKSNILHSERYIGHFSRSIVLPFSFQPKHTKVTYENGLFILTIPKNNTTHHVSLTIPKK